MHSPISLLESALEGLAIVCKAHGLEGTKALQLAMTQIDLAIQKMKQSSVPVERYLSEQKQMAAPAGSCTACHCLSFPMTVVGAGLLCPVCFAKSLALSAEG